MGMEHIQPSGKTEGYRLTFEKAIENGIYDALMRVSERFEHAENPLDNLAFHNTEHTGEVMRRARLLLEAMGADGRLTKLGELIAANHDTVQAYEVVEREDGAKIRKRFIEKNENASAEEAVEYMRANPSIFDDEDIEIVQEAIQATIPLYDVEHKTVKQPRLLDSIGSALLQDRPMTRSELVMRAIALADLGTAGMDEPDAFVEDGNKIFCEDNIDIALALEHPETLSDTQKNFFKKRMLSWSAGQIDFAQGRKALLDKELEGLPEETERAVNALFTYFDLNIQRAQSKVDIRKTMSFEELARDFGYEI